VAGLARHADAEGVVRCEKQRGADALDLERPCQLDAEAVPDAAGRKDHERQEDQERHAHRKRETDECFPPTPALPCIRDRQRNEHPGVQLCRGAEPEHGVADA
jgi:hypothetical protein